MSDYIKTKDYKFPDGETMTAHFNEYGIAMITMQALDAIFDNFINSVDRIEVVRCKDCKYYDNVLKDDHCFLQGADGDDFCSYGERADT